MQGSNTQSGSSQGGNRSSGLSWSTPPQQGAGAASPLLGGTKPVQPTLPTAKPSTPPMTPVTNRSRTGSSESAAPRLVGIFVGGVVVGALLMWGWNSTHTGAVGSTATTGSTQTGSNAANALSGSGAVPTTASASDFSAQSVQDAGTQVTIDSATVSVPTWIAVYESSNGQAIGKAMGATLFFPENNGKSGSIELLRPTIAGKTYIINERADKGAHKFSTGDPQVTDASGALVQSSFTAK